MFLKQIRPKIYAFVYLSSKTMVWGVLGQFCSKMACGTLARGQTASILSHSGLACPSILLHAQRLQPLWLFLSMKRLWKPGIFAVAARSAERPKAKTKVKQKPKARAAPPHPKSICQFQEKAKSQAQTSGTPSKQRPSRKQVGRDSSYVGSARWHQ